jgi:aspartyl-tRNA(Asn)/glutamyl-tRNA(Gln) amidotransferase subunit B
MDRVAADLPELPAAMKARFETQYALPAYDATMLTQSREMAGYFEDAVGSFGGDAKIVANWMLGEVSAALNRAEVDIGAAPVGPTALAGLLQRITDGTVSTKIAKEVFDAMWTGEGVADAIIARRGLKQISDEGEIEKLVDGVLAANAAIVAEFRAGKDKAFNSLVGKAMAASRGKANPAQVNAILKRKLGG